MTQDERINRMWDRAENGIDAAIEKAAQARDWELERTRRTFQNGFYFALALISREQQLRKRTPPREEQG